MNICYLACFDKTIFFKKLANELENKETNVFWISVSKKWTNYLLEEGVSEDNILTLSNKEMSNVEITPELEELISIIEKCNIHTLKA